MDKKTIQNLLTILGNTLKSIEEKEQKEEYVKVKKSQLESLVETVKTRKEPVKEEKDEAIYDLDAVLKQTEVSAAPEKTYEEKLNAAIDFGFSDVK